MMKADDWWFAAVVAAFILRPVVDLVRRRNAGAVVIDLGASADRLFDFVFCGVLVVGGIVGILRTHRIMFDASLIFVGAGIGFIAWWTTRFQLCEAGFWRAGRLILWSDIEGYEITEIGALSLKVNGKSLKFYCDVPPAIRQQAEELLGLKCRALQAKD